MLCDPRSEGPFTDRGTVKLPLKMRHRLVEGINSQASNELRKKTHKHGRLKKKKNLWVKTIHLWSALLQKASASEATQSTDILIASGSLRQFGAQNSQDGRRFGGWCAQCRWQSNHTALQAGGSIPGILFWRMPHCFYVFLTIAWVALAGLWGKRVKSAKSWVRTQYLE